MKNDSEFSINYKALMNAAIKDAFIEANPELEPVLDLCERYGLGVFEAIDFLMELGSISRSIAEANENKTQGERKNG